MDTWDFNSTHNADEQREKQAIHQARLTSVARELAKSPDGQYFLCWLMRISGAFQAKYPHDHAQAAFEEGKRVIGLSVLSLCVEAEETSFLFKEVNNG
ncbi:hypothetical protein [Desulfovibrio sp. SGI.169]|uniref:Bbp19 family protein n=1 Tax=Desulfovibrio sp. SGI.169 TaxID=3420561 RepID=UPI003D0863A9